MTNPADIRQASLTIGLTLFFTLFLLTGAVMTRNPVGRFLIPVLAGFSFSSYLLSHTRHFRISALLFLSTWTAASLFYIYWGQTDFGSAYAVMVFLPLTFLLGTALLSMPRLAALVVVNLLGASLLPLFHNTSDLAYISSLGILFGLGGLTLIIQRHREVVERKRLQALRDANEDLKAAIQELEEKNADLERFAYTLSHDLKSPLVTINGYLGHLEKDIASGSLERVQHDRGRIQEAVGRMEQLLRDLLVLTQTGRLEPKKENLDLGSLIAASLDNLKEPLRTRSVQVRVQSDLPCIAGDQGLLIEVFTHLLENAIQFMGDQPEPHIEIGQQGEEHGRVIIFVRDDGIGIPDEHRERIFGLFEKLDPRSGGTGSGLAIVKQIIMNHGGRIWVESSPGQGSTFYFTLQKGLAG